MGGFKGLRGLAARHSVICNNPLSATAEPGGPLGSINGGITADSASPSSQTFSLGCKKDIYVAPLEFYVRKCKYHEVVSLLACCVCGPGDINEWTRNPFGFFPSSLQICTCSVTSGVWFFLDWFLIAAMLTLHGQQMLHSGVAGLKNSDFSSLGVGCRNSGFAGFLPFISVSI